MARIVDWQFALRTLPGGVEGVKQIAFMASDECPRLLGELEAALEESAAEDVRRHAHTMRSAVSHFGAQEVIEVARVVEECAAQNDLDAAREAIPSLRALIEEMVAELTDVDRAVSEQDPT